MILIPVLGTVGCLFWLACRQHENAQIKRGREAIKRCLRTKKDQPNALFHPALGRIDIRYGRHDSGTGRGFGVSHIAGSARDKNNLYHDSMTGGRILYLAPEVIMRGKSGPSYKGRLRITHDGFLVVLSKRHNGSACNHWVFNAYDDNPAKKADAVGMHGEKKHRKRRGK
jgi:hypothetical protein